MGLVPFKKRNTERLLSIQAQPLIYKPGREPSPRTESAGTSVLGFLQNCEKCLVFKSLILWYFVKVDHAA